MTYYKPPFNITPAIFNKSLDIARDLGILTGQKIIETPLKLRRTNSIRTIQASLAIEGNTLEIDQVTDLFEGKRVIGPAQDILEAKNALLVYEHLNVLDPLKINDLLSAHAFLMKDLVSECGQWRSGNVGIFKGKEVAHVAPPSKKVPQLMSDLFDFMIRDTQTSWLLKACIFHYEFEFIHPFNDGNGRMGRLWQQLLLMKENPLFEFIPVEVMIKNNQDAYYEVLGKADASGESTPFIEFCLDMIYQALQDYGEKTAPPVMDADARLTYAKNQVKQDGFSRKEYMGVHKDISMATASRDLAYGVHKGILRSAGSHNQARYFFNK